MSSFYCIFFHWFFFVSLASYLIFPNSTLGTIERMPALCLLSYLLLAAPSSANFAASQHRTGHLPSMHQRSAVQQWRSMDQWCRMYNRSMMYCDDRRMVNNWLHIFNRGQHRLDHWRTMVIGAALVRHSSRHMLHDGTDVRVLGLQGNGDERSGSMVMAGCRSGSSDGNDGRQHQLFVRRDEIRKGFF